MPLEIERKFLIKARTKVPRGREEQQLQGYLPSKKGVTVRVRILPRSGQGFLTVKGRTKGISRLEVESQIHVDDAKALWTLCDKGVLKTRRRIKYKGHTWEVDFFHGANKGLVVAEVELLSEKEKVKLPPWIGKEVTGIKKYSCSNLAKRPYRTW